MLRLLSIWSAFVKQAPCVWHGRHRCKRGSARTAATIFCDGIAKLAYDVCLLYVEPAHACLCGMRGAANSCGSFYSTFRLCSHALAGWPLQACLPAVRQCVVRTRGLHQQQVYY